MKSKVYVKLLTDAKSNLLNEALQDRRRKSGERTQDQMALKLRQKAKLSLTVYLTKLSHYLGMRCTQPSPKWLKAIVTCIILSAT